MSLALELVLTHVATVQFVLVLICCMLKSLSLYILSPGSYELVLENIQNVKKKKTVFT